MLHWFLQKKKDTDTDQTKQNTTDQKKKPTTSPGGGSAHKDQSTGNFTADVMAACIEEIKRVEAEAAAKGEQPKFKQNSTYLYLLLLPRRGALLIKLSYVYSPGTSSNRLPPLCLHLGLLLFLILHAFHLIYPLKQGGNILDLFSSETGAAIQRLDI